VTREGTGVWVCRKCGAKMAGGAYIPQTDAGIEAKKTIKSVLAEEE
jgi:large subunit ribosomal protein L37Ae